MLNSETLDLLNLNYIHMFIADANFKAQGELK